MGIFICIFNYFQIHPWVRLFSVKIFVLYFALKNTNIYLATEKLSVFLHYNPSFQNLSNTWATLKEIWILKFRLIVYFRKQIILCLMISGYLPFVIKFNWQLTKLDGQVLIKQLTLPPHGKWFIQHSSWESARCKAAPIELKIIKFPDIPALLAETLFITC